MFQIVLVEPEIPANTGSIGRTCVATNTPLHLVGPLGFSLDDKYVKRAGLDYWESVNLTVHPSWNALETHALQSEAKPRFVLFSKKAEGQYTDFQFAPNDWLVFGKETMGLSQDLLEKGYPTLRIPTPGPVRSLNLSVAVGVVLYEALRQNNILK